MIADFLVILDIERACYRHDLSGWFKGKYGFARYVLALLAMFACLNGCRGWNWYLPNDQSVNWPPIQSDVGWQDAEWKEVFTIRTLCPLHWLKISPCEIDFSTQKWSLPFILVKIIGKLSKKTRNHRLTSNDSVHYVKQQTVEPIQSIFPPP